MSAALPLTSIRNGPISQSLGMARTRKRTGISPAKNSRNPNRRRRRRSGWAPELGVGLIGAAAATGFAVTAGVAAAATGFAIMAGVAAAATGFAVTAGVAAAATGFAITTGVAAAATGFAVTAAVAGTASWTGGFVSVRSGSIGAPTWVAAAPPVSSCSFALAGLIGAAAATGCAVAAEVAGTASWTGGFVSLASRSSSFAWSDASCGWAARQGRRRICAQP